jgi:hypothetical protein
VLAVVTEILRFNRRHSESGFDGIHLDNEPTRSWASMGPTASQFFASTSTSIAR